jgi:hypothetical protein
MTRPPRHRPPVAAVLVACAAVAAAFACGAATLPPTGLDPAQAARVLALDPDRISAADVRDTLARAPAPRIVLLQGSLAPVSMQPFADYLAAMGYPADRLVDPRSGAASRSSFGSSAELAGELAWHYERDGTMPLLIGHSQGGMLVLRTLHELAGAFAPAVAVFDPVAGTALPRTTIVDPYTGRERPVVGLVVPYATALATGVLPRVLLGQWAMIPLLRKVPDSVVEFTGFALPFDPIAGNLGAPAPYVATGTAQVRNVLLPAAYTHIGLPAVAALAGDAAARGWIDAWTPATDPASAPAGADTTNIVHAADVWHSVKRAWCRAAQQRLVAEREAAR